MNNTDKLLKILDEGAFVTHEEMAEIAREMRALQQDAERYRWLTKYTSHLFMCTEKGLDEQMNRAMGKGGK
jgi:sulfur transfer protein SufE